MSEKPKIRIARLDSPGGVKTEMCRVYRQMRRKELDTLEGGRLMTARRSFRGPWTLNSWS